jgi:hypothetical protein
VVAFTGFRLANYETPLWAVENFAAGRYNHAGIGWTQYLSLHPLTPWGELLRNEDRRDRERALLMRYPLWAIRVTLSEAPAALTFASAGAHGLDARDLVADDHAPCRGFADGLRATGSPGAFLAPSAALPGTTNLVILAPRVLTSWEAVPIDDLDLRGSLAAQDGRCPEDLWELVHYRDAAGEHPAYAAWSAGDEYVFEEPAVTTATLAR